MFLSSLQPYLPYVLPPVIGGFIGYLTNRIAIRMLFRPLKQWTIASIPVPMTPGVIPSKRHELAENMGAVVGKHLLTEEELATALKQENFQNYTREFIRRQVNQVLEKDLGSIDSLIPKEYRSYYEIALKTLKYKVSNQVVTYLNSTQFDILIKDELEKFIFSFEEMKLEQVLKGGEREKIYGFIERRLSVFLSSDLINKWILEYLQQKIYEAVSQNKSLEDIVPDIFLQMMKELIRAQLPGLLEKTGGVIQDPEVQQKLVGAVKNGLDQFIESLGPMGAMAKSFLSSELVEEKVVSYLSENKEKISQALSEKDFQEKIAAIVEERLSDFMKKPINSIVTEIQADKIDLLCSYIAEKISTLLKTDETKIVLVAMIKNQFESYLEGGDKTVRELAGDILGKNEFAAFKLRGVNEILLFLKKKETGTKIGASLEVILDSFLHKPIGKLSSLVPSGVVEGGCQSAKELIVRHIEKEMPAVLKTLKIEQIISKKIDSLDLLQLESLLLSIMSEQFKYINLFGALLGFLIGSGNVLVLLMM